jgi:ferredoxin
LLATIRAAMPIIKFIKEKKEIEVPVGANLRDEARKAGVNPHSILNGFGAGLTRYANCLGHGLCGTCRVKIVKGMENTSPMGTMEKIKFHNPIPDPLPALAFIGNEDTLRLSCQTLVNGDIEVETAPALDLFGENFFS